MTIDRFREIFEAAVAAQPPEFEVDCDVFFDEILGPDAVTWLGWNNGGKKQCFYRVLPGELLADMNEHQAARHVEWEMRSLGTILGRREEMAG